MTRAPTTLRFRASDHSYWDGKTRLANVTTIIDSGEDKGGLMKYVARKAAERAIDEPVELSRKLRLEGRDAAVAWLAKASEDHRDRAGYSGSDLHDLADRMAQGEDLSSYHIDPMTADMLAAVRQFIVDWKVEIVASEVRVANRELGYAGTTDGFMVVPDYGDMPILGDWKTTESGYRNPQYSHGKHALQLCPYSRAEVAFYLDDQTEEPLPPVNTGVGLIIFIRPEGYKVAEIDLSTAWPEFRRRLESLKWKRDAKKLGRIVQPSNEETAA